MNKSVYLVVLLGLALGMTLLECFAAFEESEVSGSTQLLWGCISLVLTALWANEDSKANEFEKPFEFGFLIYMFWPVLLPWYLYSTRKTEGLILFLGILGLFFGPWLAGLVIYVYYT
jgi:hypothetical protein